MTGGRCQKQRMQAVLAPGVYERQADLLAVIDEGVDEARNSEDSSDDGAQAGQEGGERRPLLVEAHLQR